MKRITVFVFALLFIFTSNGVKAENFVLYADSSTLYSYEEMENDIEAIKRLYPSEFIQIESLGKTLDQRDLYHIMIGSENASRHVMVVGAIHAREYITSQLVMKQVLRFCEGYDSEGGMYKGKRYDDLIDGVALHIVPMINPDGVTISQLGLNGLRHRVTRQRIYQIYQYDQAVELSSYLQQWKANANGIDLNRNFDAMWDIYEGTPCPSSDHYKGKTPTCEPESQALKELTERYHFVRTISYHTQGECIYWYFGQEGDLKEESYKFAKQMASITGYRLDSNYAALDPAGYKDWALRELAIPSLTIEVGKGSNPIGYEQLEKIFRQNQNVILEMLYALQNDNLS